MKATLLEVLLVFERWRSENTPIMFLSKTNNLAVGVFGSIVRANEFRIILHSGAQAHAIVGLPQCSFEFLDMEQVKQLLTDGSSNMQFEEVSVMVTDNGGCTAVFAGIKIRRT